MSEIWNEVNILAITPDFEGFGGPVERKSISSLEKLNQEDTFEENSFDRSVVDEINPLVKVEVINKKYNLRALLTQLGYDTSGSNMYCPFHPDEMTGKPSAKYHEDTDRLYCFSESKSYSAYHAIKLLYGLDVDKVFKDIWSGMSLDERHDVMDKYEDGNTESMSLPSEWEKYKDLVLDKFRKNQVTFKQYKNALYKVLMLVGTEEKQVGETK